LNKIFNNDSVVVVDNFFEDFHRLEEGFRDVSLWDIDNHPTQSKDKELYWPGYRSVDLKESMPFMTSLYIETVKKKVGIDSPFKLGIYTHLRTEETEKEDYVHQDNCWVSGLVYLSRTNLDSGTQFYDSENGNITQTVKFVQNRAVFFKASMWHRVLNGHGTDIGDGRYTLNTFFGYL